MRAATGLGRCASGVSQRCTIPPARERRVRILHKQGELERSQRLLADIAAQPLSSTEHIFSQRFGRRGQGFQPPLTTWPIEETPEDVERYVLEALTAQGGWGVHSENTLVKTLTGLMYWEAVFYQNPVPLPTLFKWALMT